MESKDIFDRMMAWAAKDVAIIIVCMLTLGACLYTIETAGSYQLAINDYWMQQWQKSGCVKPYVVANFSFGAAGRYLNGTED